MYNLRNCLDSVRSIHREIKTEQELQEILTFMSEKNREIFEERWNLKGSNLCLKNPITFQSKDGDSWYEYHTALAEFDRVAFEFSYARMFKDYKENLKKGVCFGIFISSLFGDYHRPASNVKLNATTSDMEKRFKKAFNFLTPFEKKVVTVKYGLDGSDYIKSVPEVAEILGKSDQSIVSAENRAFKRLRNPLPLEIITRG